MAQKVIHPYKNNSFDLEVKNKFFSDKLEFHLQLESSEKLKLRKTRFENVLLHASIVCSSRVALAFIISFDLDLIIKSVFFCRDKAKRRKKYFYHFYSRFHEKFIFM